MTSIMAWPPLLPEEIWQPPEFGPLPDSQNLLSEGFVPWGLRLAEGDQVLGWAHPSLASLWSQWPTFLTPSDLAVFESSLADRLGRSGWRDEAFALVGADGRQLSVDGRPIGLERSLFRQLGLLSESVQLNLRNQEGFTWISQRAFTKAIDPGLWDAAVAGGLGLGEQPGPALVREAWEEAGLPNHLAQGARHLGAVRVCRRISAGLHQERVWTFDLQLAEDWVPSPQDGEVAQMRLVDRAQIASLWRDGQFNHEAAVASLCWLSDGENAAGQQQSTNKA